jgi:hypothetical protein
MKEKITGYEDGGKAMYTNDNIEERIRRAAVAETPDMLPEIFARIEAEEAEAEAGKSAAIPGAGNDMPAEAEYVPMRRRKRVKLFSVMAACAAAVVISIGAWGVASQSFVDSIVEIDVNPSIELSMNSKDRVLEAKPLNPDAENILSGMDLKGVDLNVAVNALIGSMLKHGYVSELKNSILVSIDNGDAARRAALERKLSEEIGSLLSANSVNGAVLSQAIGGDPELKKLAEQYGISAGKAALVRNLVESDARLVFEEVAALSINDINLLVDSRKSSVSGVNMSGKASEGEYIGEAKAREVAFSAAGATQDKVTRLETSMDLEGGVMVYEVDFHYNNAEYEFEVDAVTGQLIKKESEAEAPAQAGGNGGNEGNGGQGGAASGGGQGAASGAVHDDNDRDDRDDVNDHDDADDYDDHDDRYDPDDRHNSDD